MQQHLSALHEHAAAFERLLVEESEALGNRDHETLESLAASKLRLSEGMDRHFKRLLTALPTIQADNTDPDKHLPEALRPQWHALRPLLGKIREQNQNNGQQLHLQSRQVDQAMTILRGAEQGSQADTYGADGQTRSANRGGRHVKV
nr:flagellar protein FlgN [Natronospira proteinivora]